MFSFPVGSVAPMQCSGREDPRAFSGPVVVLGLQPSPTTLRWQIMATRVTKNRGCSAARIGAGMAYRPAGKARSTKFTD